MFSLEALVNENRTVKAEGSANFPRHYHELKRWITENLTPERLAMSVIRPPAARE